MLMVYAPTQGAYALAMQILRDAGIAYRYLINPRSRIDRDQCRRLLILDDCPEGYWIMLPQISFTHGVNEWEYQLYRALEDTSGLIVCQPRHDDDGGLFVPAPTPAPAPAPAGVPA